MADVIVYGGSDQGRCTIDVIEREGRHRIVGIIDDARATGGSIYGHPVLGSGAQVGALREEHPFDAAIVAIGDNGGRARVVARLTAALPDLAFATTVDPSAVIGREVTIGGGSVLMAGVIVNGSTTIGRHALLCARASLDHDADLGDFASLAPAATTGGRVRIGAGSAIGLGASIIHGIRIGADTVVGAGAVVVADLPDRVVAMGVPARAVRGREPDEPYL